MYIYICFNIHEITLERKYTKLVAWLSTGRETGAERRDVGRKFSLYTLFPF